MNPIVECAERILLEHPHPALRLTELHELLAERFDRSLEQSRLRRMLEEHPKVFRVLDPVARPLEESRAATDGSARGRPVGRHRDTSRWSRPLAETNGSEAEG